MDEWVLVWDSLGCYWQSRHYLISGPYTTEREAREWLKSEDALGLTNADPYLITIDRDRLRW